MTGVIIIPSTEVAPCFQSGQGAGEIIEFETKDPSTIVHVRGLRSDLQDQLRAWLLQQTDLTKDAIKAFIHQLPVSAVV